MNKCCGKCGADGVRQKVLAQICLEAVATFIHIQGVCVLSNLALRWVGDWVGTLFVDVTLLLSLFYRFSMLDFAWAHPFLVGS